MFDLKFHDTKRRQFLFDDTSNTLELVKTVVGADKCNNCWNNTEVADYDNWAGNSKYTAYQKS